MIAVVLWAAFVGLAVGVGIVEMWQRRRERRQIAYLVRLLKPYHAVGTSAPSDIVVGQTAGWRHVG